MSKDVDIYLCKINRESFVIVVCCNGYYKIVEYLFYNGVEINICLEFGVSLFLIVCEEGYVNIV